MQRLPIIHRCYLTCITACAALGSAPILAQSAVSGSIGATSDFVFRGLSYTRGDPAIQGSLDLELPAGIYLGTFVSTTNPNAGASPSVEVDLWAGYTRSFNDWASLDLRYTHYMYPDDPRVAEYDRDELTATIGVRDTFFLSTAFSPNTEAIASTPGLAEGNSWAIELSARHLLSTRWTLSAGVGRYLLDDIYAADYDYWGATISADFSPLELHFAVLGADNTAERIFTTRAAGERVAVTALYRFGFSR